LRNRWYALDIVWIDETRRVISGLRRGWRGLHRVVSGSALGL